MDIHMILAHRKQLWQKGMYMLILALVTGIWLGSLLRGLAADSTTELPWLELAAGILVGIFWVILISAYKRNWASWELTTAELLRERESFVDKSTLKLKDHESKQIQAFATCRHDRLTTTLKELHSLMTSHLKSVTHETNDAALKLINQLTLIHDAMSYLLQTVSANRKESDEIASDSQSTLEDNRETMDHLQSYIDRRLQEIDHDHQMARELQDQAAIMSDLTKLIETVSKQTTIVATNAKIEATRAGRFGQAFSVIADEVTNLSSQIGNSSKQIIQSIDHMGKSIEEKFKAKLDKTTKAEETNLLNGLKNQLINMGKSYQQLESFNRETLDNINSSSHEIKSKVNDSLMAIQFQDITQQQIEVILKSLNLFEAHLSNQTCFHLATTKGKSYEEFDINQIRNLYVMKKQHDIHDKYRNKTRSLSSKKQETVESGDITLF